MARSRLKYKLMPAPLYAGREGHEGRACECLGEMQGQGVAGVAGTPTSLHGSSNPYALSHEPPPPSIPSQPQPAAVTPTGLPGVQQQLALEPAPRGSRKVVVATNIAETSLTIQVGGWVWVGLHCKIKWATTKPVAIRCWSFAAETTAACRSFACVRQQPHCHHSTTHVVSCCSVLCHAALCCSSGVQGNS